MNIMYMYHLIYIDIYIIYYVYIYTCISYIYFLYQAYIYTYFIFLIWQIPVCLVKSTATATHIKKSGQPPEYISVAARSNIRLRELA